MPTFRFAIIGGAANGAGLSVVLDGLESARARAQEMARIAQARNAGEAIWVTDASGNVVLEVPVSGEPGVF